MAGCSEAFIYARRKICADVVCAVRAFLSSQPPSPFSRSRSPRLLPPPPVLRFQVTAYSVMRAFFTAAFLAVRTVVLFSSSLETN